MEGLNTNQKESGVSRIIGFDEEKEGDLLDYFRKIFEENNTGDREKEKSAELREMIGRVNLDMVEFLEKYGINAINVPQENVHIIDTSKFSQEELKKFEEKNAGHNGYYSAKKQILVILKEYEEGNKLSFMLTLVHEMLHIQGFFSYQETSPESAELKLSRRDEDVFLNTRRSGFSIGTLDGNKLFFDKLNEVVITELEILFEHKYFSQWSELAGELQSKNEYVEYMAKRDHVSIEKIRSTVASVKNGAFSGSASGKWVSYPYHDDRENFRLLIDRLYEKNMSNFSSREEIFDLFATATMTGRILPVARLIEKTYGKGSFRKIGEKSAG